MNTITKHTKELSRLKDRFIEYYAKLPIQKLAAEFIGVDEDTITNWKKTDKVFSDRLGTAKSEWALENAGMVKNKEWLLERIMREEFWEDHKNDNNDPIPHEEIERIIAWTRTILPASQ